MLPPAHQRGGGSILATTILTNYNIDVTGTKYTLQHRCQYIKAKWAETNTDMKKQWPNSKGDRCGRDRMVVGFITYVISAYHHWCCEFESQSRRGCTTLCDRVCRWLPTDRWFSPGPPVSSTNKTDHHDITEMLLKVPLNTIKPNQTIKVQWAFTCQEHILIGLEKQQGELYHEHILLDKTCHLWPFIILNCQDIV